jgi:5,10-methylene-tetrahydrofolate dehydrogenase/methenyl tetrahydrofolate cyclohydrolase
MTTIARCHKNDAPAPPPPPSGPSCHHRPNNGDDNDDDEHNQHNKKSETNEYSSTIQMPMLIVAFVFNAAVTAIINAEDKLRRARALMYSSSKFDDDNSTSRSPMLDFLHRGNRAATIDGYMRYLTLTHRI